MASASIGLPKAFRAKARFADNLTEIVPPLYSDSEVAAYVRACHANQAPMTFNLGIYQNGTMSQVSLDQMRRLGQGFGPKEK